jgi:hypothetical protein
LSPLGAAATKANPETSGRDAGGCGLYGLEGPGSLGCATSLLSSSGYQSSYSSRLRIASNPLVPDNSGTPAPANNGGAPLGDQHSNQPGPAPGGVGSGGAPGGAGGGGAPASAFLSLAGLLLLAAPHALRRLRLARRPYLTAFFVLIPERPG